MQALSSKNTDHGTEAVVISGVGAVLPEGPLCESLGIEPFETGDSTLVRKLRRICAEGTPAAVEAAERALKAAGATTPESRQGWALYTSQCGYQHPDLTDIERPLLVDREDTSESVIAKLWNSKDVSPFLVINGLSNNLLGVASLHLGLQGDCSAFIRDSAGAASAMAEAVFNIVNGYCDAALVVSGGYWGDITSNDFGTGAEIPLSRPPTEKGAAAVALVVESESSAKGRSRKALGRIDEYHHGYCDGPAEAVDSVSETLAKVDHLVFWDEGAGPAHPPLRAALDKVCDRPAYSLKHVSDIGCPGIPLSIAAALIRPAGGHNNIAALTYGSDNHFAIAVISKETPQ